MSKATQETPRVRLLSDIDLAKAKPGCGRCNGTGKNGYRSIPNPENESETIRVPVICRCVTRRGGVAEDQLDKMAREVARQLESGIFAQSLAKDILALPEENLSAAIEMLNRDLADEKKSPEAKKAVREALDIIIQKRKEAAYGDA